MVRHVRLSAMDAASWNAIAGTYEDNVLSVFENDTKNVVSNHVSRLGSRRHTAVDIGCGAGKFLPMLANEFKRVHAVDFSNALLARARQQCIDGGHETVQIHKIDLCKKRIEKPIIQSDFALCVNALLDPSLRSRLRMWENIARSLKRGGHLLLVVPSLESALLANARLVHWSLDEGMSPKRALREGFAAADDCVPVTLPQVLREGVLETGGTPTKHFLREELEIELPRHGFGIEHVEKLEYDWSSEFTDPPKWMKKPYPWDWTIIAKKTK